MYFAQVELSPSAALGIAHLKEYTAVNIEDIEERAFIEIDDNLTEVQSSSGPIRIYHCSRSRLLAIDITELDLELASFASRLAAGESVIQTDKEYLFDTLAELDKYNLIYKSGSFRLRKQPKKQKQKTTELVTFSHIKHWFQVFFSSTALNQA